MTPALGIAGADDTYGGECSGVDFTGVTDVFSSTYVFLALNRDACTGHCWGYDTYGGECSGVDFTGVTDVFS